MVDIQPKKKTCFVVGPIGKPGSSERDHADWLLDGILKPVFDEHFKEFEIIRSDRIDAPGMIDTQMINHLPEDDLVIADMSLLNANAFYEIGIRHMSEKPIIHMFVEGTIIPFDVHLHRAVSFGFKQIGVLNRSKSDLRNAVFETITNGFRVDNPVTRARGALHLKQSATPTDQIISERLDRIDGNIAQLSSVVFKPASNPIETDTFSKGRFYIRFKLPSEMSETIVDALFEKLVRDRADPELIWHDTGIFIMSVPAKYSHQLTRELEAVGALDITISANKISR